MQRVAARGGVILACGGFEADPELQAQYWPGGPALNAAYRHNTGDGIRMAQAVGADLWHMWHYHGAYGFPPPDPAYPYGVRVKRLPDWRPGDGGEVPAMTWILVDRRGRRFMNEYEPYMQDTGWRPFAAFDPLRQDYAHRPGFPPHRRRRARALSARQADPERSRRRLRMEPRQSRGGRARHDPRGGDGSKLLQPTSASAREQLAEHASSVGTRSASAAATRISVGRRARSIRSRSRPSMLRRSARSSRTRRAVPVHDAEQRVLDPFGAPIPGLFAAGECGSAFGHLYLSGGNLAECFIGGGIAGRNAARRLQSQHEHAA